MANARLTVYGFENVRPNARKASHGRIILVLVRLLAEENCPRYLGVACLLRRFVDELISCHVFPNGVFDGGLRNDDELDGKCA